jgi:hypothetical protein
MILSPSLSQGRVASLFSMYVVLGFHVPKKHWFFCLMGITHLMMTAAAMIPPIHGRYQKQMHGRSLILRRASHQCVTWERLVTCHKTTTPSPSSTCAEKLWITERAACYYYWERDSYYNQMRCLLLLLRSWLLLFCCCCSLTKYVIVLCQGHGYIVVV